MSYIMVDIEADGPIPGDCEYEEMMQMAEDKQVLL